MIEIIDKLNTLDKFKIALDYLVKNLSLHEGIDEIILFGSIAREEATDSSDIDICIISKIDKYELLTDKNIVNILFNMPDENLDISVDKLVYADREKLTNMSKRYIGTVESSILSEGVVIFKRSS